jgi:hypothetical protein
MLGYREIAKEDADAIPMLVDFHGFSHKTLRHRVSVGVHRDISIEIDDPVKALVDGGKITGKLLQLKGIGYGLALGF